MFLHWGMCLLIVWWESKESKAGQGEPCQALTIFTRAILPELDVLCLWKDTATPSGTNKKGGLLCEMTKFFPYLSLLLYRCTQSSWWSKCSVARTVQGLGDLPFTLPLSLLVSCWQQSYIFFFLNKVCLLLKSPILSLWWENSWKIL